MLYINTLPGTRHYVASNDIGDSPWTAEKVFGTSLLFMNEEDEMYPHKREHLTRCYYRNKKYNTVIAGLWDKNKMIFVPSPYDDTFYKFIDQYFEAKKECLQTYGHIGLRDVFRFLDNILTLNEEVNDTRS